jgi:hypothetical protein
VPDVRARWCTRGLGRWSMAQRNRNQALLYRRCGVASCGASITSSRWCQGAGGRVPGPMQSFFRDRRTVVTPRTQRQRARR